MTRSALGLYRLQVQGLGREQETGRRPL